MAILIVLALLFGAGGLLFASQATGGVAAIAVGCLFAILARMAQAAKYHSELVAGRKTPEV